MSGVALCLTRSIPRVVAYRFLLLFFMSGAPRFFLLTETMVCVNMQAEIVVVPIMLP